MAICRLISPLILNVLCLLQYPKGLGSTVEELDISNYAQAVISKTKFSMIVADMEQQLQKVCDGQLKSLVLFGIEVRL